MSEMINKVKKALHKGSSSSGVPERTAAANAVKVGM
jgi:hypothetical protein